MVSFEGNFGQDEWLFTGCGQSWVNVVGPRDERRHKFHERQNRPKGRQRACCDSGFFGTEHEPRKPRPYPSEGWCCVPQFMASACEEPWRNATSLKRTWKSRQGASTSEALTQATAISRVRECVSVCAGLCVGVYGGTVCALGLYVCVHWVCVQSDAQVSLCPMAPRPLKESFGFGPSHSGLSLNPLYPGSAPGWCRPTPASHQSPPDTRALFLAAWMIFFSRRL